MDLNNAPKDNFSHLAFNSFNSIAFNKFLKKARLSTNFYLPLSIIKWTYYAWKV